MKKTKRFLAIALSAILLLSAFAACGGKETPSTSTPATSGTESNSTASSADSAASTDDTATDGDKIQLTLWHTYGAGPALDALEEIAANYNASNDKNVEVKVDFVASRESGNTNTMDKLMASVASGSPPEIALMDNFIVPSWAAQTALEPLDAKVADGGYSFDGIYEWLLAGSAYNGDHYSVPYNTDTRALFYNKDMFEAAGLDPDKGPATIGELEEMAEKLTIKEGSTYKQVGFIPWQFAGRPIYTWGWSFGGSFYDADQNVLTIDDPKIIEALEWEVAYSDKFGGVEFVEFASGLGTGAEDPFVTGTLAMAVRGNFDIANIATYNPDLNYGIVPLPSKVEGENITWAGGWGFVIPRGAAHQEEALDFMMFCASDDSQRLQGEKSTNLSVVQDVNEELWGDNPLYDAFMTTLPTARIRPPVPVGQQLWDNLGTVLENALYKKGEPAQLLAELNESINAELDAFKE